MTEEEKITQELTEKFADLKDTVVVKRRGRVFATLTLERFEDVFRYAVEQMGFQALSAITGMDRGADMAVIYHINKEGRILLSLTVGVSKEQHTVKTITPFFPSADIYERELEDLLGFHVTGLAPGNRYPLPDDWKKDEHPLRKDWKGKATETPEVPYA